MGLMRSPELMREKSIRSYAERQERRKLRREKQRMENVGRAKKMHDARILDEDQNITTKAGNSTLPKVLVGCSGWFYWHWRGTFYPDDLPTRDWFAHYSKRFDTVELNAPFYSWPTVGTVKGWTRQSGRRKFVFTVKASELITHTKKFSKTGELIRDFGYIADMLGSKMGCFLFQMPPSFHYTPARLKRIVTQLDPLRRNVVEFRHKSWWNPRVYVAFRDAGIIFCSCSGPRLPEDLILTREEGYIRFHGTKQWYRHNYTDSELTAWADKVAKSGAKRIWAYFNNDREGYALSNARSFRKLLKRELEKGR